MPVGRWREWRTKRRARRFLESERATARAFELLEEVAGPVIATGAARVERYTVDPGDDPPYEVAELRPERSGCAAVSLQPVPGAAWIDVVVGPGGAVHELDLVDGWEEELRACIEAAIEGRYRYREYAGLFGGAIAEIVIIDRDGEARTISTRSSPDETAMPIEERYEPYDGVAITEP